MKIVKAEITGFGKWQNQQIHFDKGNQLFFGGNEAGKSTLYQFIQAMLFGFPAKGKKKQDYTPYAGAAYGGKLWLDHPFHGEILVTRYKQQHRGRAQVFVGTQTGDDRLLQSLLTPLTKELFQQVFTFQQEQLQQLDALKEEQLHESLISLGITGSQQLFEQRQQLQQDAQLIYKKKGQKQSLNQALENYQQLQADILRKQQQEELMSQHVVQEMESERQLQTLQEQLQQLQQTIHVYQQQQLNFPLYREWQELLQEKQRWLVLTVEQQEQLASFYQEYQQLSGRLEALEGDLEKYSGADQHSAKYFFFVENELEITELVQQEYPIVSQQKELDYLNQQLVEIEGELQALEAQWQWQRQTPPAGFAEKTVLDWQERAQQESQRMQEVTIRLQVATDQHNEIEAAVTQLEQQHPELLQVSGTTRHVKRPQPKWLFLLVGLLSMIVSFFVPGVFRGICWLMAGASGIIGLLPLAAGSKDTQQQHNLAVKARWQELLGQLDTAAAAVQELTRTLQQQQQNYQEQQQQFKQFVQQHQLGGITDPQALGSLLQSQKRYNQLLASYQELQQQQRGCIQQQQQLQQQFAFLQDWLPLQEKNLLEKLQVVKAFQEEMLRIQFAQTYQENAVLQKQLAQAKRQQKQLVAEYQPLLTAVQLHYPSEIPDVLQRIRQQKHQAKRLAELAATAGALYSAPTTLTEIETALQAAQHQRQSVTESITHWQEQKQRVQLQVEALQKDGTLDWLYQEEERQRTLVTKLLKEWSIYQLTASLIDDLSTELSQKQLPQLLHQAGYFMKVLTDGIYTRVFLEGETLWIGNRNDRFSLYDLSTGTKDQLIMAIRFAYLSLQAACCPIIIDDGWLHYDTQRKQQLAKLFVEFGKNYQVICFSSDKEMVSYYQEHQQPVNWLERMKL